MDPISIATSAYSLVDNALRPWIFKGLGVEPDSSLSVINSCAFPHLDIVCIPDVCENPLEAWTVHEEGLNTVNWLTDLLPTSFPSARILLFRYSLSARTCDGFARHTIYSQAFELLEHLWLLRRGVARRRPVVFLVHNAGELIARSALAQASAAVTSRDAHLRSIYLSTGSLFIISASEYKEGLSDPWRSLLGVAMEKVPHTVLAYGIPHAQTSRWLQWQQDRFRAISSTIKRFKIFVRYTPDNRARWIHAINEARRPKYLGHPTTRKWLHRSEPGIMKYAAADQHEYQKIVQYLTECIESGEQSLRAKWVRDDQRNSATPLQNDDMVAVVMRGYNEKLKQTTDKKDQWVGESERQHLDGEQNKNLLESICQVDILQSMGEQGKSTAKDIAVELRVMRQSEELFGHSDPRTLECLYSLSECCRRTDLLDTAESIMLRLLVSWEEIFGMRSSKVLLSIQQLGMIKMDQQKYVDSSLYLSKAIELNLRLSNDKKLVIEALRKQKKSTRDEIEVVKISERIWRLSKTVDTSQKTIAKCRVNLAAAYDMQRRYSEAESLYSIVLSPETDLESGDRLLAMRNHALHWQKRGKLLKARNANEALLEAYKTQDPAGYSRDKTETRRRIEEINRVLYPKKKKRRSTSSYTEILSSKLFGTTKKSPGKGLRTLSKGGSS